jgi:hypothetical protein
MNNNKNTDDKISSSDNDDYIIKNYIYNNEIIEYQYISNAIDNSKPSLYKEILRYININGLNDCFQMKLKELNSDHYNINDIFKNNSSKLIELINRWCWHQYSNSTIKDYVIPYVENGKYDYDRFVDDLNYILNIHNTEHAIKTNNKIILELDKTISSYLYIQYHDFISRKNQELNIFRDYIDKKVKLLCIYKHNNYSILLHHKVYNILKTKLIIYGKKYNIMDDAIENIDELLDEYIFCLVFRYSYMDSGNQQLAINHNIKFLYKNCGINFELFGSAINTISDNYCSLFYDIEKFFGSNGDFFDFEIKSGIYWCNPPYDDTIMTKTVYKLLNIIKSNKNIAFIVTIPIWDSFTQSKIKTNNIDYIIRNYNKDTNDDDHKDFIIYSKLKPYIKDELIIPKHRIPYFNYKKYSNINAVNTYMLIIYDSINTKVADNLHLNFDKIIELDNNNFFL